MKHTPPPWTYDGKGRRILDALGQTIAKAFTVLSFQGQKAKRQILSEEQEANAYLMAASPELLDALRDCITDDGACSRRTLEWANKRLDGINRIASAAIAKAEPVVQADASRREINDAFRQEHVKDPEHEFVDDPFGL